MSFVNVLKNSFVITVIINVTKAFLTAYENSMLKKNVSVISVCYKNSKTHYILSKYADKKPYYRYSLIYKLIMAIAGLFDKFFGIINSIAVNWLKGSKVSDKVKSAVKSSCELKLYGFGLLFMSIPIGSIISLIFAGGVSALNMAICWTMFIIGLVFVIIASCDSALKGSAVIKDVGKFIDLIR